MKTRMQHYLYLAVFGKDSGIVFNPANLKKIHNLFNLF
jgi:hypothetical protein